MEQMRIGTSHASIDIKQHLTILAESLTQTVCNLYYFESTFLANYIFFVHLPLPKINTLIY